MSTKVLVTESSLNGIAEAIRAKNGAATTYKPGEMAAAIRALDTGGITPTGTKQITQNGVTDVTQYASANVQVPNTYAAGDEGKVVSNGALVAQTSRTVTANGTYDTTENNEVVVNVSGGGSTLITKNITQNGTYNASSDNADGYSQVVVNVPGGGTNLIEEWDFTSATPTIGTLRSAKPLTVSGVTFDSTGAIFDSYADYIRFLAPVAFAGVTIEIDVGAMQLTSGEHRRFIMCSSEAGLIYRSTGVWSFYGTSSGWATNTTITDGGYFANSTVKIYVDQNSYWHIYKDGVLVYEPNRVGVIQSTNNGLFIGAAQTGIIDTTITGLRCY